VPDKGVEGVDYLFVRIVDTGTASVVFRYSRMSEAQTGFEGVHTHFIESEAATGGNRIPVGEADVPQLAIHGFTAAVKRKRAMGGLEDLGSVPDIRVGPNDDGFRFAGAADLQQDAAHEADNGLAFTAEVDVIGHVPGAYLVVEDGRVFQIIRF